MKRTMPNSFAIFHDDLSSIKTMSLQCIPYGSFSSHFREKEYKKMPQANARNNIALMGAKIQQK